MSQFFRIIPRLDLKPPYVIKTIQLEGLRRVGDPSELIKKYEKAGADEFILLNRVTSLFNREPLFEVLEEANSWTSIPITAGGGIQSKENAISMVQRGADRVCINSAAIKNPELISEISLILGSQAIVIGVEAKRVKGGWEALIDMGREKTSVDAINWISKLYHYGAGEILLTSIDSEGMDQGFDLELLKEARAATELPIITHGGFHDIEHIVDVHALGCQGVAISGMFHFQRSTPIELKKSLSKFGILVRES